MTDVSAVLLYYKYLDLTGARPDVAQWMQALCAGLDLKGRVRIAFDGVNVTVGGSLSACNAHIAAVQAHPLLRGTDIDFKRSVSSGPRNHDTLVGSKFDRLVVRECDELVTLGPRAMGRATACNTAVHLTPEAFHQQLLAAQDPSVSQETVLLDTRNVYESRIGHFVADGVATLKPPTRCFSDWPTWVDSNEHLLRDKRIMMYCTGGVRCERASAYLREKGPAFAAVTQLRGGIVRYLEAFPSGGLFHGKNFVFDERAAHGPAGPAPVERASEKSVRVVGRCLCCTAPHDDYGSQHRCTRCRMLVLVCHACAALLPGQGPCTATARKARADVAGGGPGSGMSDVNDASPRLAIAGRLKVPALSGVSGPGSGAADQALLCEMCREAAAAGMQRGVRARTRRRNQAAKCAAADPVPQAGSAGDGEANKIRVLALHGFRENSSRFHGRLRGLIKRTRQHVHLHFVDAPHVLHATCVQGPAAGAVAGAAMPCSDAGSACHAGPGPDPGAAKSKRGWFVSEGMADARDAHQRVARLQEEDQAPVAQQFGAFAQHGGTFGLPGQLGLQTSGWRESLAAVRCALGTHGPFDGILAFSQGCAMATLLLALQELAARGAVDGVAVAKGKLAYTSSGQGAAQHSAQDALEPLLCEIADCKWGFKFAMLCSGHLGACPVVRLAANAAAPLQTPVLHVFGAAGQDCQVEQAASEELVACFAGSGGGGVERHGKGHIIPSARADVDRYLAFFQAAMQSQDSGGVSLQGLSIE